LAGEDKKYETQVLLTDFVKNKWDEALAHATALIERIKKRNYVDLLMR
jgi:hypothetical protein